MKIVIPAPPNFTLIDSKNELQVKIRTEQVNTRIKIATIVAFSFWVLAGAFSAFLLSAILRDSINYWSMTILPFGIWVVGGTLIISMLVFQLTFRETITVSQEAIKIEYESWLFRKHSYQYLAKYIQGLRVSPFPALTLWSSRLVLDYGGKTVYFGSKLNESEARRILSTIRAKFDGYDFAN